RATVRAGRGAVGAVGSGSPDRHDRAHGGQWAGKEKSWAWPKWDEPLGTGTANPREGRRAPGTGPEQSDEPGGRSASPWRARGTLTLTHPRWCAVGEHARDRAKRVDGESGWGDGAGRVGCQNRPSLRYRGFQRWEPR